jgi:hypothetical protein
MPRATPRLFAMGSDERYVSPYLLRPLRTLHEVLGGRGSAVETARGDVEATPTRGDHSVRPKIALRHDRPDLRGTTD